MMYPLKRESIQQRREALLDCLNRATAAGANAGSNLLVMDVWKTAARILPGKRPCKETAFSAVIP